MGKEECWTIEDARDQRSSNVTRRGLANRKWQRIHHAAFGRAVASTDAHNRRTAEQSK